MTGIGLIIYFRMEKARMERRRIAEATKGIGKPKVGGPFDLVDHDGRRFTHEDLKGKYSLVCLFFTIIFSGFDYFRALPPPPPLYPSLPPPILHIFFQPSPCPGYLLPPLSWSDRASLHSGC